MAPSGAGVLSSPLSRAVLRLRIHGASHSIELSLKLLFSVIGVWLSLEGFMYVTWYLKAATNGSVELRMRGYVLV
jgi:hypothetical protein